jgi:hypothetical protein
MLIGSRAWIEEDQATRMLCSKSVSTEAQTNALASTNILADVPKMQFLLSNATVEFIIEYAIIIHNTMP